MHIPRRLPTICDNCHAILWQLSRNIVSVATEEGKASIGLSATSNRSFSKSGYFPWNHGKFICKGEGKWSCPDLRSYRSYGSEVTEWPYERARRLPRHFRTTPLAASLSMISYYHLFIGEVRTIRNETTYPIHGKYPLNQKFL